MRIRQLDLVRFGAFEDMRLVFDEKPCVHLVYGPNGAGKSTTLDALRSVLYGIRPGERAFRFESKRLRLGAHLVREGGEELCFVRRTSTKSPLWSENDDEPLDEERLLPFLGNFSRDQFETMFGLDLDTMVAGGSDLLKGEGEIGEALFAAGLGGNRLSAVTSRLGDDVRSIWVPGSPKARINALIAEHKTLAAERSRALLSTSAFDKDRRELARLRAEAKKDETARRDARAKADRLGRLARALGVLGPLDSQRAERDALGIERPLDPDRARRARVAFEDAHALDVAQSERASRLAELAEQQLRLRAEAREDLIAASETVEDLQQRRGSFREAAGELSEARAVLEEARAARDEALRRAGAPAESASDSRASGTNEELEEAVGAHVEQLQQAAAKVEQCLTELKRAEATEQRLRELANVDLSVRFVADLVALSPFHGDLDALAALRPPSLSVIQAAADELAGSAAEREANERNLAACVATEKEAREGLDKLRADPAGVPPTVDELASVRARRDEALRGAIAGNTEPVEAFAAVERADGLGDRLRDQSARVAERAMLEGTLERAGLERREYEEKRASLDDLARETSERWRTAWEPCGFEPDHPSAMATWFDRRSALLARVAEVRAASAEEADKAAHDRALRASDLEAARETERDRDAKWRAWAETQRIDPSVGAVAARKRVRSLVEVRAAESDVERAGAEVERRKETVARFIDDVARAAESVKIRVDEDTLSAALERDDADIALAQSRMDKLSAAVGKAKRAEAQLEDSARRIAIEKEGAKNAESRRVEILRELEGIAQHAGVDTSAGSSSVDGWREELKILVEASDKARALDVEIARLEASFQENALGQSPDDVRALVGERTTRDLDDESETWRARAAEFDERLDELAQRVGALAARVEGEGSDEAARIEARIAEIEAELETATESYVEARVAQFLLDREVEQYRAEAQGPLLARAQELFEVLTLGAYVRLHPSEDKGKEVMVARRPDGSTVHPGGMSTGTCDQLYLALRIASVEHMLSVSEPMPFIADDLFVNFDDDRTDAALRVLAQLAESTQVIVFSHHESVVDTALRLAAEGIEVDVIRLSAEVAREA